MNAKKVKAIRRYMRKQGIDPNHVSMVHGTVFSKTGRVNDDRPGTCKLKVGSGRWEMQETKRFFAKQPFRPVSSDSNKSDES